VSRAASPSSLPAACEAVWAGERLHLLAGRALWWPARRTLFVADLHLGKAAAYRALGQPVPGGTTQQNLARLDALIAAQAPQAIVFLGDFLHAPEARTPALLQAALAWRSRHGCAAARGMAVDRYRRGVEAVGWSPWTEVPASVIQARLRGLQRAKGGYGQSVTASSTGARTDEAELRSRRRA